MTIISRLRLSRVKVIIGLILIIVSLFSLWQRFSSSQQKTAYQTAKVTRGSIVVSVSASGQVLSAGRLPILTQASGQVKEVYVKNGEPVTAGQKILSLTLDPAASAKNASALSSYLAANAAFYSTQSTMFSKWKTYMDLATSSTYQNSNQTPIEANRAAAAFHIAKDDWLKAEADYKNQQAVVSATWLNYQQTAPDIVAPTSGTIEDLTYVPGMLISSAVSSGIAQSQAIANVVTDFPPIIAVNLSEVDVNQVTQGAKTTITIDALPDKSFTGQIIGINKTGVVTSGVTNYPATIKLDGNPPETLPNMSASVTIIVNSKDNILLIPSEAIRQNTVQILKDGQPQVIKITLGLSSDTQTEVISGLLEGDEVITSTDRSTSTPGQSPFSTVRFGGNFGSGGTGTRR